MTTPIAAEPRKVTVTRYRCPFCPRGWSTRKRAAEHIQECFRNPRRWQSLNDDVPADPS